MVSAGLVTWFAAPTGLLARLGVRGGCEVGLCLKEGRGRGSLGWVAWLVIREGGLFRGLGGWIVSPGLVAWQGDREGLVEEVLVM